MGLFEFIKLKVEVESIPNYKIANMLQIKKKQVGALIVNFGLKKSKGFPARFEKKYGAGSIKIFKSMIENPEKNLSDVGRYFGFSREYARQVYNQIYGTPYTQAFNAKKNILRTPRRPVRRPRIQYLHEIRDKIRSLGISAHIIRENKKYHIISNGFRLDIRISSTYQKVCKKQYFRIIFPKRANFDCDFILCLCEDGPNRTHYLIPASFLPKSGIWLIPKANSSESKYSAFRENWEQLKENRRNKLSGTTNPLNFMYLKNLIQSF